MRTSRRQRRDSLLSTVARSVGGPCIKHEPVRKDGLMLVVCGWVSSRLAHPRLVGIAGSAARFGAASGRRTTEFGVALDRAAGLTAAASDRRLATHLVAARTHSVRALANIGARSNRRPGPHALAAHAHADGGLIARARPHHAPLARHRAGADDAARAEVLANLAARRDRGSAAVAGLTDIRVVPVGAAVGETGLIRISP